MGNEWTELIQQILLIVITAVVPVLTAAFTGYLKRRGIMEQLQEKRVLVARGVEFAEQAFQDLGGHDKYNVAIAWISDRLTEAKIPFSEDEVRGLIDSAVWEMKNVWIEEYE